MLPTCPTPPPHLLTTQPQLPYERVSERLGLAQQQHRNIAKLLATMSTPELAPQVSTGARTVLQRLDCHLRANVTSSIALFAMHSHLAQPRCSWCRQRPSWSCWARWAVASRHWCCAIARISSWSIRHGAPVRFTLCWPRCQHRSRLTVPLYQLLVVHAAFTGMSHATGRAWLGRSPFEHHSIVILGPILDACCAVPSFAWPGLHRGRGILDKGHPGACAQV